jgi:hypothetical protein
MARIVPSLIASICILFCYISTVAQQPEIAPGKKALIAEIISVTKADKQVEALMQSAFEQMDKDYPKMIEQIVNSQEYAGLTANDKKFIIETLVKENIGERSLRARLFSSINYKEYVERSVYPLYDKFFTEAELGDLLAFLKSPTGQKMNSILPELFAESVRLAQEYLVPKIIEITNTVVEADISKARKAIPKK